MGRGLIRCREARKSPPFPARSENPVGLSGISTPFEMLSQSIGQIIHALLTRAPLSREQAPLHVRLACVKHAASVRSEPGSNSPVCTEVFEPFRFLKCLTSTPWPFTTRVCYLVFKDQIHPAWQNWKST